jgi:hypothetical protein
MTIVRLPEVAEKQWRCIAISRAKEFVVFMLLSVILCGSVSADVDTIVHLEGTALVGLPTRYSPAELDLESYRLRVGRHVMEFSPLLRSFFERQPYELQILGSWDSDHEPDRSPPYLLLEITPKSRDYTYRVTFDLNTLHLLGISVTLRGSAAPPDAFTAQTLQIALTDLERKQIAESIKLAR